MKQVILDVFIGRKLAGKTITFNVSRETKELKMEIKTSVLAQAMIKTAIEMVGLIAQYYKGVGNSDRYYALSFIITKLEELED